MFRKWILFGALFTAATTFAVVGCGKSEPTAVKPAEPHKDGDHKDKSGDHKDGDHKDKGDHKDGDHKDKDGGHAHKPGAHGGMMVSLGKDSYHAEVLFEKEGAIRLYLLGKDESKSQEIEVQELVGFATVVGSKDDAVQVKFAADRQKGDAAGKTTQFLGKLPHEFEGKKVKVTINNIQVGTERFRIEFSNEKSGKADHDH